MSDYLTQLTLRLLAGCNQLPPSLRDRHANYLKSVQAPDGGFCGRQGGSDLYYTGFALRGLTILEALDEPYAARSCTYLKSQLAAQHSIVDFFSLIYSASLLGSVTPHDVFDQSQSDWPDRVAQFLSTLRRSDGGFAKAPGGEASSTYHTFLVLLVHQLIDRPLHEPQRIADFLQSQRCEEGGFREIRASRRAGTNPTAAAMAALRILQLLDAQTIESTVDFLCDMQTDEGGLRANTRIPIADLLSTFTGILTLEDLGAMDQLDLDHLRRFVDSLQLGEGGFHAALWDQDHDVEYTFYGIGCLALLN